MKNVKQLYLGIAFASVWSASASAAREYHYHKDMNYWIQDANAGKSEASRLLPLRRSANAGDRDAQFEFAIYLFKAKQPAEANVYLQMAKDQGRFGNFPVLEDMQKLAAAGFDDARGMLSVYSLLDDLSPENMFRIARCFSDAGFFQDMKTSLSYMCLAADSGYAEAYFPCMKCFATGLGCTKDLSAAREYGLMAERAGFDLGNFAVFVRG
jgi:TPR repeat protein